MTKVIGLKELRTNLNTYLIELAKGKSFLVVKKSKPIFKISPPDEDERFIELTEAIKSEIKKQYKNSKISSLKSQLSGL